MNTIQNFTSKADKRILIFLSPVWPYVRVAEHDEGNVFSWGEFISCILILKLDALHLYSFYHAGFYQLPTDGDTLGSKIFSSKNVFHRKFICECVCLKNTWMRLTQLVFVICFMLMWNFYQVCPEDQKSKNSSHFIKATSLFYLCYIRSAC